VVLSDVTVQTGAQSLPAAFAGIDQVNVMLPNTLAGTGTVNVAVPVAGTASNAVTVKFQ
jgi:uncharacterized protein (TIGR03437 family)